MPVMKYLSPTPDRLCILAVFAPSFVMTGVPKAMFLPLSLAIAFAMICSYTSAQTLVPVISNWILKEEMYQKHEPGSCPVTVTKITVTKIQSRRFRRKGVL